MAGEYTLGIITLGDSHSASLGGKLRFNLDAKQKQNSDPNNNSVDHPVQQNLACFELMREGIQSINIKYLVDEQYKVEFTKGSTQQPHASKSISVQIIHKRAGVFSDSNDNIAVLNLKPTNNLVKETQPAVLSTFQVIKKAAESNRKDGVLEITDRNPFLNKNLVINRADLLSFTKFSYRIFPRGQLQDKEHNDTDCQTSRESFTEKEFSKETEQLPQHSESNSKLDDNPNPEWSLESEQNNPDQLPTITFTTVLAGIIEITLELRSVPPFNQFDNIESFLKSQYPNLEGPALLDKMDGTAGYNEARADLLHYNDTLKAHKASSHSIQKRNKGLHTILKNESGKSYHKGLFVKSMVYQRLKALGVQQFDCNTIIERWQKLRLKTNWNFAWTDDFTENDEEYVFTNLQGETVSEKDLFNPEAIISPYISKPNSSLFRLTPSGHISGSIFHTFATQVDSLKGIINSATCTLIQTSIHLLLPEIKLLYGHQLEKNSNPIFIQQWVHLIMLAAVELRPSTPKDVSAMVNRELRALKKLSSGLYKSTQKIYHKIKQLLELSDEVFTKSLIRIHPKSLTKSSGFDSYLKKFPSPECIHYDPANLKKMNLELDDLFHDHVFFSESTSGELLVKNELDGFWGRFMDLEFVDRRDLFLALTRDLQLNLRTCLSTARHLQEIYKDGYPGNITALLKDVVTELKFTAKRNDLTMLVQTSLVAHIHCLRDLLRRLSCIGEEVGTIARSFHKNLKAASFDRSLKNNQTRLRNHKDSDNLAKKSSKEFEGPQGYHKDYAAGVQHSRALLTIPISHIDAQSNF